MSEEPSDEKAVEEKPQKNFLVRCEFESLDGDFKDELVDVVPGYTAVDVEEYVTGWLAVRGYKIKRCYAITEVDQLKRLVRNVNR